MLLCFPLLLLGCGETRHFSQNQIFWEKQSNPTYLLTCYLLINKKVYLVDNDEQLHNLKIVSTSTNFIMFVRYVNINKQDLRSVFSINMFSGLPYLIIGDLKEVKNNIKYLGYCYNPENSPLIDIKNLDTDYNL